MKIVSLKQYKEVYTSHWIPKNIHREQLHEYHLFRIYDEPIGYEARNKLIKDPDWFPCPKCQGRKGHRHTGYPNEDYGKWKDCKKCKATGQISEKAFMKLYNEYVEDQKAAIEREEEDLKRLNGILEILSDKDLDILANYHFNCCECGIGHSQG